MDIHDHTRHRAEDVFVRGCTWCIAEESQMAKLAGSVEIFGSGATRSASDDRLDFEGFLSPIVLERYAEYLHKHRVQADGSIRDSDNWQRGIPLSRYMKGFLRHAMHLWQRHRGWPVTDPGAADDIEEDLCAVMFNSMGYLHVVLKDKISAGFDASSLRGPGWEEDHG